MTRRLTLFLVSIAAFVVVMGVWLTTFLVQPTPPTAPAGQTATVKGAAWHLDFMKSVPRDDPSLDSSYLPTIDGAIYVVMQFGFESQDPQTVSFVYLVGSGRKWSATCLSNPDVASPCYTAATTATQQWVVAIPASAVQEIKAVDVVASGTLEPVRLNGTLSR